MLVRIADFIQKDRHVRNIETRNASIVQGCDQIQDKMEIWRVERSAGACRLRPFTYKTFFFKGRQDKQILKH